MWARKVAWQMHRHRGVFSRVARSRSSDAEDMEEEINLFVPSFAPAVSATRGCGWERNDARNALSRIPRVVPEPLTTHRDATNGADVLHSTGRPASAASLTNDAACRCRRRCRFVGQASAEKCSRMRLSRAIVSAEISSAHPAAHYDVTGTVRVTFSWWILGVRNWCVMHFCEISRKWDSGGNTANEKWPSGSRDCNETFIVMRNVSEESDLPYCLADSSRNQFREKSFLRIVPYVSC